jgi:hypothetical protein
LQPLPRWHHPDQHCRAVFLLLPSRTRPIKRTSFNNSRYRSSLVCLHPALVRKIFSPLDRAKNAYRWQSGDVRRSATIADRFIRIRRYKELCGRVVNLLLYKWCTVHSTQVHRCKKLLIMTTETLRSSLHCSLLTCTSVNRLMQADNLIYIALTTLIHSATSSAYLNCFFRSKQFFRYHHAASEK